MAFWQSKIFNYSVVMGRGLFTPSIYCMKGYTDNTKRISNESLDKKHSRKNWTTGTFIDAFVGPQSQSNALTMIFFSRFDIMLKFQIYAVLEMYQQALLVMATSSKILFDKKEATINQQQLQKQAETTRQIKHFKMT